MDFSLLKHIRETYNLTREEFSERLNITLDTLNTWEYRTKKIPKRKINFIESTFPEYFKRNEVSVAKDNYYKMVRLYDMNELSFSNTDPIDGLLEQQYMENLSPEKKRLIPKPSDNGNYLVVRVNVHSMDDGSKRSISEGEEILVRECEDFESIKLFTHSKLFLISSTQGVFLKQIVAFTDDYITCRSFNDKYEDFNIDLSEIIKFFTVESKVRADIIF